MPTLVSCPDCGVPAEITERFCLPSTDGPVDHIVLHCAADHHFRMAADRLPALRLQPQATQRPAAWRPAVLITPYVPPRTHQLCIHCRQSPAGFWVSNKSDTVVRDPGA